MKYIIVDILKVSALYGINNLTLVFSTFEIAEEVANRFFQKKEDYLIVRVNGWRDN